jgi:putative effector of murein hydrolase
MVVAFLFLITLFMVGEKSLEPVQVGRSTRIKGTILLLPAFVAFAYPLYLRRRRCHTSLWCLY